MYIIRKSQFLSVAVMIFVSVFYLIGCIKKDEIRTAQKHQSVEDSLALVNMITLREASMINRDINGAMNQFSEDATWINSQGYYFEGKDNITKFHAMLANNDSLDYFYEAGLPKIRVIDKKNAIAYYSWKMFWYKKEIPKDTTFKEIGLMTLIAHKSKNQWKWVAVTNQHTPWFYEEIDPVPIE